MTPQLPAGFEIEGAAPAQPPLPAGFEMEGAQPPPNTLADMAKGGASGVAQGAIGMSGMAGDIGSLVSAGVDKVGGALGVDPQTLANFKANEKSSLSLNPMTAPFAAGPTSQDLTGAVEKLSGQKLYNAQTVPGQFAQTAGQFLPAVIGGPESLASKLLTRVAAPAVASEGAGQLTAGTDLEPYARIAGALVGGAGAGAIAKKVAAPSLQAAPSIEQLSAAKDALYNSPEIAAVQFKPSAMQTFTQDTEKQLLQGKVDKFIAPNVMGIVDRLTQPRFGASGTISDFDLARQSLSSVPPAEGRAAGIVRKAIDNYLGNIPQADLMAGNASAANKSLLDARANTAAMKRSEDIDAALGRAENQAGSSYSGLNSENATRQQLRPILNQKQGVSKVPGFEDYTPQEISALKTAVNGTNYSNAVRYASKLMGGGGGFGALAAGTAAAEGAHQAGYDPLTAITLGLMTGVAGHGLNRYGAALTARNGAALSDLLRMRSPLGAPIAASNNALLAAHPPRAVFPPILGLQSLLSSRFNSPQYQSQ